MAGSSELKTYVTCALLLYVKFIIAVAFQSLKRYNEDPHPAEDDIVWLSALGPGSAASVDDYSRGATRSECHTAPGSTSTREQEARWERIIQSDLESVPLALILFGVGVFADGNTELFEITLALYTIARCFHTIAYAAGQQPHRVIACWFGVTATAVGALNSLAGVYRH
jgi:glutathione S-transferase